MILSFESLKNSTFPRHRPWRPIIGNAHYRQDKVLVKVLTSFEGASGGMLVMVRNLYMIE